LHLQEIADLKSCHETHPVAKFLNACGDAKRTLDACFREEKQLRIKLNKLARASDGVGGVFTSGGGAGGGTGEAAAAGGAGTA